MRLGAEIEYLAAEREIDGHQQITGRIDIVDDPSVRQSDRVRVNSQGFVP